MLNHLCYPNLSSKFEATSSTRVCNEARYRASLHFGALSVLPCRAFRNLFVKIP